MIESLSSDALINNNDNNNTIKLESSVKLEPSLCNSNNPSNKRKASAPKRISASNESHYVPIEKKQIIAMPSETNKENDGTLLNESSHTIDLSNKLSSCSQSNFIKSESVQTYITSKPASSATISDALDLSKLHQSNSSVKLITTDSSKLTPTAFQMQLPANSMSSLNIPLIPSNSNNGSFQDLNSILSRTNSTTQASYFNLGSLITHSPVSSATTSICNLGPTQQNQSSFFDTVNLLNNNQSAAAGGNTSNLTAALMQAILLQAQQQQQTSCSNISRNNLGASSTSTGGLNNLNNLLKCLSPPTPELPSYPILYSQYITIITQIHSLIRLIESYNNEVSKSTALHEAATAVAAQAAAQSLNTQTAVGNAVANFLASAGVSSSQLISNPNILISSQQQIKPDIKQDNQTNLLQPKHSSTPLSLKMVPRLDRCSMSSPDTTVPVSISRQSISQDQQSFSNTVESFGSSLHIATSPDSQLAATWRNAAILSATTKKGRKPNGVPGKKSNFRGTSEMENRIDPNFKDIEGPNGNVLLCEDYPEVCMPRDTYDSILSKCIKSATRLIRLLMKHFFMQKELAASSLSGEGVYKRRLNPDVIEAIKRFIRRRHPFLKTGTMSLCMTDVCVQARRVSNNQRSRTSSGAPQPAMIAPLGSSSRSHNDSNNNSADHSSLLNGIAVVKTEASPSPASCPPSSGQQSMKTDEEADEEEEEEIPESLIMRNVSPAASSSGNISPMLGPLTINLNHPTASQMVHPTSSDY